MKVFIAGIDGYLGWPLALYLAARGHDVAGADCFLRRAWVQNMKSLSAIPIEPMHVRRDAFEQRFGKPLAFWEMDLQEYVSVKDALQSFGPETVVHLAECPSAPYSMIDVEHAVGVQRNNLTTTFNLLYAIRDVCPDAHLVKLGTMGEYGTPNLHIPEGFF